MEKTFERRLCRAVELGFQKMETARKARYKFLAQYVGPFYSKNKGAAGSDERKASPLNLMYNAVTTMVPNLVYNDPRVKIRTEVLAYRNYAGTLELATNHLVRKIKLRHTLRKVITDALFCAGFVKTGLAVSGQTLDLEGKIHDIGEPFADRVDPDDIVIDPMARDWDEMSFVGNRFRMAKKLLLESGLYPNDKIEKLCSRYTDGKYRQEAASIAGDANIAQQYQDVAEYVDLVEVYLPQEQIILTIPYGIGYGDESVLRVVDYEGPESGPYHMLGFAYVPDNVLPVPPASIWYYLHVLGNRIARKIARQAERMKRVLAYDGTAVEDAQEIADAEDGETIRVDNIDGIKEVGFGGTTEDAYQYMSWVQGEFSKQAGNIDLLGGTAANQPTATQSEMLQTNSQVRLSDMQNINYTFTGEVATDLAFFLHTDPLIDLMLTRRQSGIDRQVRYTPEMREGDFFDYMLSVQPYSMARQDPNLKVRRVLDFIQTGLPAMAQAFQLLGPAFNIEAAMNLVMREVGIEEADELINSQALQARIQQMMQMIPPDGKAAAFGQAAPSMAPPPLPGGGRPQQPNPGQMGPTGGVSPDMERMQQQQATAGELQAAY
jgi:hypothetical protein